MNCERFRAVSADLARDQIADANERASAQAHVDECNGCRKAWSEQQELSGRLRTVADRMRSERAPEHLEQQLLTAFRDRIRVHSIQSTPRRLRYWTTAAAAVLLVAFGLFAWRWHVASVRQSPAQASSKSAIAQRTESPRQEQSPIVAVTGTQSTKPLTGSAPKRSLSRRHSAPSQLTNGGAAKRPTVEQAAILATNARTREVATEFVPVGYGSALDLQDGGQLVRVELPRSALARFGLPMNMDRADERIKADVLVGADGLARAIRFVSEGNR